MPSCPDSNAARAALWLVVLAAVGCHTTTHSEVPKHLPGEVISTRGAGARIVTIVRPTEGLVRLSLWIDAGSRDASPPQVATIAAWSARENAGGAIEATVYPDATELATSCASDKLDACLNLLRKALSTRATGADQLERLRIQLRDGRMRALAKDPMRRADAAAMRSLLGDDAKGFFALGESEDDSRADGAAVTAFLGAHYGPTRALFIAAGDADPEHVHDAVTDVLQGTPAASQRHAERTLSLQDAPKLEVIVDDRDGLAVALAAATLADAQGIVTKLERSLARTPDAGISMSSHLFEARGAAIGVLRLRARDLESAIACSARELAAIVAAPLGDAKPASHDDDLESLSRDLALSVSTRSSTPLGTPGFAMAALVRGGRADGPRTKAPDATDRARRLTRMQEALTRALADATPSLRGEVTAHAASVVTRNGARIEVRRVRGDSVAISVRSALGAAQDPALLLGRSALLATLTTTACAGMAPEQLRAELDRMHATLTPDVDAESYGVLLRLPSHAWRDGVDLALRCMQSPSLDPVHVADALMRLQSHLGSMRDPLGMRALAASLVAPRAPGMFAPWGDPERLGNENVRELAAMLPRARMAARMAVSVVGDVDVHEAALQAARRVIALPSGNVSQAPDPGELSVQTSAPSSSATKSTVLVIWHARALAIDTLGAQVSAAALQTILTRTAGIEAAWRDGDAGAGTAWSALALRVAPEALPNLSNTLTAAGARIDDAMLGDAIARARAADETAQSSAASRVDVTAERIARARLSASAPARLDAAATLRAARTLLRSVPVYVTLD